MTNKAKQRRQIMRSTVTNQSEILTAMNIDAHKMSEWKHTQHKKKTRKKKIKTKIEKEKHFHMNNECENESLTLSMLSHLQLGDCKS